MSDNENKETNGPSNSYVPVVVEPTANGERSYDLFSRLMQDRIITIEGPISDVTAKIVKAQLLFLESQDSEKDIYMYINSGGGSIYAGMDIYDTMMYIKPDIVTVSAGIYASMASFLTTVGTPGKRYAMPNAEDMVHQPLSGAPQSQQTDIELHSENLKRMRKRLERKYQLHMGLTDEEFEVFQELTERDTYLNALMAKKMGLIDDIMMPNGLQEAIDSGQELSASQKFKKMLFDDQMRTMQEEYDAIDVNDKKDPRSKAKKIIMMIEERQAKEAASNDNSQTTSKKKKSRGTGNTPG